MPVRTSNNKIPARNARSSDVATRAIQEIMPTRQQEYQAAFRVQGFEGVLYNRLYQGLKCTCQSTQKHLASRLDESGKAKPGVLNELMTGAVFDVSGYGRSQPRVDPFDSIVSPQAPVNKYQGVFDNVAAEPTALPTRIPLENDFGDNGPLNFDVSTLASDWDDAHLGHNEVACAVCLGSGFVGGYTPLYGKRIVKTVDQVQLESTDQIDAQRQPWRATTEKFEFTEVLPYGAVAVDAFRVRNNNKPVAANFTIDGNTVNEISILKYCDGRPHRIAVQVVNGPAEFTHVEIQFKTSTDDAFFEFPRLSKSQDTSLLDSTEPFQITMSPLIPVVQVEDLFTESTEGRTLVVQNVNTWNSKQRQLLGWECQVRVVQPQEIYNVMPRRGRIKTKPETTNLVHDNSTGYRRI